MKNMKYISFAIGAILYLGSMSLLNNAYAHNHSDQMGVRMLFQDMDLTDEQRKEVRSIMSSSIKEGRGLSCLLYTSPSPRDAHESRMPSSA